MATKPINERITVLETQIQSFQDEIKEIKKNVKDTADAVNKLPEVMARMIQSVIEIHEKNSKENLRLVLQPTEVQVKDSRDAIHNLRNRVQTLEFMKWQLVGIFTGAGIVIQLVFKFIF